MHGAEALSSSIITFRRDFEGGSRRYEVKPRYACLWTIVDIVDALLDARNGMPRDRSAFTDERVGRVLGRASELRTGLSRTAMRRARYIRMYAP